MDSVVSFWFRYPPQEHQAELPYILHLLVSAHFPFSLFYIKLPFALLSVGIVILLWAIASDLFGPLVGLTTAGLAAINPWLVVMGRTGYEATPTMFFYLLSFLVILKTKRWNVLWTLVPLVLAFYSYIATKVLFVPFIEIICIVAYIKNKKKYSNPYIILFIAALVITLGFFIGTKSNPSGSRLGELFLPNSVDVASTVDKLRKSAIVSPITHLVLNKYVVYMQTTVDKIFRIFSPSYLFVEGDEIFLPIRQGFFYYLDAIFLCIGAIYIGGKHRAYAWALLALLFVGTLPHIVSTTAGDFSTHLVMLFPFLIIIIGTGIAWTIRSMPHKYRGSRVD